MNKNLRTALIIAGVGIAAYVFYRWWQARQAALGGGQGAVSQLGTNLNSLAPELVGGSSGPSSGPQVTMPVTITLTEQTPEGEPPGEPDTEMESGPNVPALSQGMQTATDGTPGESDNAMQDLSVPPGGAPSQ